MAKRKKKTVKKSVKPKVSKKTKTRSGVVKKKKQRVVKNKFDFVKYVSEQLEEFGAEKLSTGHYALNGYRVKPVRNGVYWHNKFVPEIEINFDGIPSELIKNKGNKPFTEANSLSKEVCGQFVTKIVMTKTKKQLNKEARAISREKKQQERIMPKAPWCSGCLFSPEGLESTKCSKMKSFSEQHGINSCQEEKWWNSNWCENAVRVYEDESKIFLGHFNCALTKERCPYNSQTIIQGEFVLKNNYAGENYKTCPTYKGRSNPIHTVVIPTTKKEVKKQKKFKWRKKNATR